MKRPSHAQFDNICRLCLEGTNLVNIFERHPKTRKESPSLLVRETVEMLGLVIEPGDGFPKKICIPCKDFLRQMYKFRNQCQEASDLLAEAISSSEHTPSLSSPCTAIAENIQQAPLIPVDELNNIVKPPSSKPAMHIPSGSLLEQVSTVQSTNLPLSEEAESTKLNTSISKLDEAKAEPAPEADSSSYFPIKVETVHSHEHFEDPENVDNYSEEYCEYLEQESEAIEEEVITGDTMLIEEVQDKDICMIDEQDESSSDIHGTKIHREEETETENELDYRDTNPLQSKSYSDVHGTDIHREEETENELEYRDTNPLQSDNYSKTIKGQTCHICGKKSTCLKYHMMCHTGERPFPCKLCDKTFRTSTKLNIHVNGVHLKVRKYDCKLCDKKFLDAGNLRNHMVTHGGERKFACDFEGCGKTFALQGTLTVHKKLHNQEKQYACEFCSKMFMYKWLLVKHKRTHTGEKPYECDVCHKRFSAITHMHTHKKTHDPDREKHGRKRKFPFNNN